jgi:hypothetical protein
MSIVRLVPAWLHGIGDYAAGLALLLAGLLADGPDKARATGIVLGAALIAVSLVTRYPLGLVKAVPFPVHSAGDYLGGLAAIVAPFALDFWDDAKGLSTFYVIVGAVVIALSLVTDYAWGHDRQTAVADRDAGPSRYGAGNQPTVRSGSSRSPRTPRAT